MGEFIFNGKWASATYPNIRGTCRAVIKNINNEMKIDYVVIYDRGSNFRPGKSYEYTLRATYDKKSMRLFAQTALAADPAQYMLTISLDKISICAFYASVYPIDCGTINIADSKANLLKFL